MSIIKERRKINKALRKAKTVFLMAHRDLDLDALGSSIGMNLILKRKKKKCFIIIDDKIHEPGVEKVLRELEGCINIIKSEQIEEKMNKNNNKNLLIILDTNKSELVQSQEALKKFDKKIVIDHHDVGKTTIKDATLIIDNKVSSACYIGDIKRDMEASRDANVDFIHAKYGFDKSSISDVSINNIEELKNIL